MPWQGRGPSVRRPRLSRPERRLTDAGGTAAVERVFREEYGRLIASLVRRFGDIDIAEEAAGEALVAALEKRRPVHCLRAGRQSLHCPRALAKGCSRHDHGKESDNTKDRLLLHPAVARQGGQRGLPQPDDQTDDQYGGDAG